MKFLILGLAISSLLPQAFASDITERMTITIKTLDVTRILENETSDSMAFYCRNNEGLLVDNEIVVGDSKDYERYIESGTELTLSLQSQGDIKSETRLIYNGSGVVNEKKFHVTMHNINPASNIKSYTLNLYGLGIHNIQRYFENCKNVELINIDLGVSKEEQIIK